MALLLTIAFHLAELLQLDCRAEKGGFLVRNSVELARLPLFHADSLHSSNQQRLW